MISGFEAPSYISDSKLSLSTLSLPTLIDPTYSSTTQRKRPIAIKMGITDFFSDLMIDASSFFTPTAHADAPSKDDGNDDNDKKDGGGDDEEGDKKDDDKEEDGDDDGDEKGGEKGGDDEEEEEEEEEEPEDPKPKLEAGMYSLHDQWFGITFLSNESPLSARFITWFLC